MGLLPSTDDLAYNFDDAGSGGVCYSGDECVECTESCAFCQGYVLFFSNFNVGKEREIASCFQLVM